MASVPAAAPSTAHGPDAPETLAEAWSRIRGLSERLAAPLAPEDQVVQTMPDVSPTKWHLAHVTWFFERFVLPPAVPGYQPRDERWHYLFNSYYHTVGEMHARPRRGLLSRPTVTEILDWRAQVDAAMAPVLARAEEDPELVFLMTLGLNHEQQHQELLLTDIQHVFWSNPLGPAYDPALPVPPWRKAPALTWHERSGYGRMVIPLARNSNRHVLQRACHGASRRSMLPMRNVRLSTRISCLTGGRLGDRHACLRVAVRHQ